jgi:hypothetical protein
MIRREVNTYNSHFELGNSAYIEKEKVRLANKSSLHANKRLHYYQERQNRLNDANDILELKDIFNSLQGQLEE